MSGTASFRNQFGEVFADRLVFYSSDPDASATQGESIDFASARNIAARILLTRDEVLGAQQFWGYGYFALVGLGMFAAAGSVFFAWHFLSMRWSALAGPGAAVPSVIGFMAALIVGGLTYPYRVIVTLRDKRLQSARIGSLREARAFIKAARAAQGAAPAGESPIRSN